MKRIKLTRGKFALVDDEDFEYLSKWKWYALLNHGTDNFYAMHCDRNGPNKKTSIIMHRVIMDAPDGKHVDHINHDTLDNRRTNLRIATNQQNQANARLSKANKSGYKGVSWSKSVGKWQAKMRYGGKQNLLGYFDDKVEAAKRYAEVAKEIHGEFALDTEIANAKNHD